MNPGANYGDSIFCIFRSEVILRRERVGYIAELPLISLFRFHEFRLLVLEDSTLKLRDTFFSFRQPTFRIEL